MNSLASTVRDLKHMNNLSHVSKGRKSICASSSLTNHRPMHPRQNHHHASTVPPKRSKNQLNETRKGATLNNKAAGGAKLGTFGGGGGGAKGLQIYSLSKLVADVKNQSTAGGGTTTGGGASSVAKTQVSRCKEVNKLAALTKTTTSIQRTISSVREEPKKNHQTNSSMEGQNQQLQQRQLQIAKKTNELRAQDYWDRFRESKLEKMRQHKLNVEQRMRDNGGGTADNYNYYWDNINHCYSDQTHARHRNNLLAQRVKSAGDTYHSLPASWYTDNIYSNWSIDLDEEEAEAGTSQKQNHVGRRTNRNSCDINGNSPYRMSDLQGFEEADEGDICNNNLLVDRYRAHLKPTTPTKYVQSNGAFVSDPDEFEHMHAVSRGIPKSKSFGQEQVKGNCRGRFGLGSAFMWQGRRSKTTNLLMDLHSRFRNRGTKHQRMDNGDVHYSGGSGENGQSGSVPPPVQNQYYCDNRPGEDFHGVNSGDERGGFRNGRATRRNFNVHRNHSMDDDFYRSRCSRFDFHHNLLLNSEEEDECESEFEYHTNRASDFNNNNHHGGRTEISESFYGHPEISDRIPTRPTSLNLRNRGQRFNRGRSLDDYEYSNRLRNLNYIDKNLNIENFLNSARNISQQYHADSLDERMPPEMAMEQIFNPNVEYRTQLSRNSKINRLRNFSSLDLDWGSADLTDQQDILERTSTIFRNVIHSPQSTPSLDDIAMKSENDTFLCPVGGEGNLNFIIDSEPMPKKSCMKKTTATTKNCGTNDYVLHHPQQSLDYKLNTYYPQEEFNDPPPPPLISCHPCHDDEPEVSGSEEPHVGLDDNFHLENNCCTSIPNNNDEIDLDVANGNLCPKLDLMPDGAPPPLDPNTLHIINNIFSIYKPNQYSPVNWTQRDNVKVDNYCKKISLPSTMRPLGEPMSGQNNIDMDDDGYMLSDQNNNVVAHDVYDACFEEGPSAILGGNRRRKSTFFASLKRPLMVVKSKSCHDSVAASDDHWFCSGDLPGKWHNGGGISSSTNFLNTLNSPTDSNNSLLEKTGLFKFSPTSTTETSYFYPFDYYFNAAPNATGNRQNTGTKKKSLIKLRSTTRPLSFSH